MELKDDRDRILEEIAKLKEERGAIILVHNYQLGEVQDIADLVGDSLELSRNAARTEAGVIVFCGVHFMAETASILCPDKVVLLPDLAAGCPMADMITADELRGEKGKYPDATVVCYINSSAEVKAESDLCCTSANAAKVIETIPDSRQIIFIPDQYLGHYISRRTGKEMVLWPGYCPTHVRIQPQDIIRQKAEHPKAKVIVHPECRPEVIDLADDVLSTSGMCRYASRTDADEIIVGTEIGILYRLGKENPQKSFIPVSEQAICPQMKLCNPENILKSLREMSPEVKVPEEVRIRAKAAVDRMLALV